jgi:signal transduction histidine kinase
MRPGRLVLKIYLGSVLAVLVGSALSFLLLAKFRSARQKELSHLTEYLSTELALRRHDPQALGAEVARLKRYDRVQLSLYDLDGRLIASTTQPPLPMVSPQTLARLYREPHLETATLLYAHAIKEKEQGRVDSVAVVRYGSPSLDRVLLPVGVLLVLFTVLAVVFTRHLAVPLSRIAAAAQRFGRGELVARAGIRRNDEIGEVGLAFDEMADRVTRLMTSQQELLANVSHELRTPMSRIRVALDLLMDGVADQSRELWPEIAQDLAELERLVDDVMTVTRLDLSQSLQQSARSGEWRTPLRLAPIALTELLGKATSRFRSSQSTHELLTEVQSDLPVLQADAVLLRRVIENLLDNARKYSEPGSQIRLYAAHSPNGVSISVRDAGIGMDAADLKQVFTPFFRSDKSRSRATGGVGLGLVLARRVIEAHGGTIRIESTPGQGTTVHLHLPTQPR